MRQEQPQTGKGEGNAHTQCIVPSFSSLSLVCFSPFLLFVLCCCVLFVAVGCWFGSTRALARSNRLSSHLISIGPVQYTRRIQFTQQQKPATTTHNGRTNTQRGHQQGDCDECQRACACAPPSLLALRAGSDSYPPQWSTCNHCGTTHNRRNRRTTRSKLQECTLNILPHALFSLLGLFCLLFSSPVAGVAESKSNRICV